MDKLKSIFKMVILSLMLLVVSLVAYAGEGEVPMPVESRIVLVMAVLFALSELLASIPSINSNSIFQLIKSLIKSLYGSLKKK